MKSYWLFILGQLYYWPIENIITGVDNVMIHKYESSY